MKQGNAAKRLVHAVLTKVQLKQLSVTGTALQANTQQKMVLKQTKLQQHVRTSLQNIGVMLKAAQNIAALQVMVAMAQVLVPKKLVLQVQPQLQMGIQLHAQHTLAHNALLVNLHHHLIKHIVKNVLVDTIKQVQDRRIVTLLAVLVNTKMKPDKAAAKRVLVDKNALLQVPVPLQIAV